MNDVKKPIVKPTEEEKFCNLLETQVKAFDMLFKARLVLPLLILVYSTIDIVAYVWQGGDDKKAGPRFRGFIKKYMIKYLKNVDEKDLWGARCALIHTGIPESTASKTGSARQISYSWGTAKVKVLEEIIERRGEQKISVATSIENLLVAMSKGIDDFLAELEKDDKFCKNCMSRAKKFYAYIPVPK